MKFWTHVTVIGIGIGIIIYYILYVRIKIYFVRVIDRAFIKYDMIFCIKKNDMILNKINFIKLI